MANDLDVSIGRDVINFGGPIPVIDGIYQMTDDPNIDEDSENPEWIGYDSIADTYDRRSAPLDLRVRLAEAVLATDPGERAVVLDVGAGTGLWSVPFAKAGARVIAVDISNRMLARLRASADEIGVDVVACRANALELPIDDNSIEFVSVSALLHLIRNPERVVKEIQRVLRPGGALMTPHSEENKELSDETAGESTKCWEIWSRAYGRHHEIAQARGLTHTPRPGWWGNKQHENLLHHFSGYGDVAVPEATVESTATLREHFEDLRGRAFSDKLRFDAQVNEDIVEDLAREIETRHGPEVWDLRHTTRSVYSARLYYP